MKGFLGIILLAGGVVLVVYGLHVRETMQARMSEVFSSSTRNKITVMLAGGTACAVAGAALILANGRRR